MLCRCPGDGRSAAGPTGPSLQLLRSRTTAPTINPAEPPPPRPGPPPSQQIPPAKAPTPPTTDQQRTHQPKPSPLRPGPPPSQKPPTTSRPPTSRQNPPINCQKYVRVTDPHPAEPSALDGWRFRVLHQIAAVGSARVRPSRSVAAGADSTFLVIAASGHAETAFPLGLSHPVCAGGRPLTGSRWECQCWLRCGDLRR